MPVRILSQELQEKAKKELNEVPSRLQEDINHIKEWMLKEPHLEKIKIDDQLLVTFLRSCKFRLQQTKEKLDVFYSMRTLLPEYYADRNPFLPEIQGFFSNSMYAVLPETENAMEPRRFLINSKNIGNVLVTTFIKASLMVIDIIQIEHDGYVINGQEIIVDLKHVPFNYLTQLTPKILKTMVFLMQSSYASRIKGIYFINTPPFLQAIVGIFKSFLSEKIKNRVYFYSESNIKELYDVVPLSVFPKEYGGNAGTMSELSATLKMKLESYKEWFIEDAKNCSDESKRVVLSDTCSELRSASMEGSFRKLEID